MSLSPKERVELAYLARSFRPLWGGHLGRGQPITDPQMQRWLDLGYIERVGTEGYVATKKCKDELQQTPGA